MNKQDLFAANKPLEIRQVEILGHTVGVREMSAKEYSQFSADFTKRIDADEGEAWFAAWTLCDPANGALLFTPADLPKLMEWPGHVLRDIWVAGAGLNGLDKKTEEEREKNSPTPSEPTS